MTRDLKLLAIWCGASALALAILAILFSSRAAELEAARTKATQLHADYAALYPEAGVGADEALVTVKRLRDHQEQARGDAERALIGELPDEYQRSDVTEASSRLRADLGALKQRAERQKTALPGSLPFEGGFDPERVSLQLAQLYLYKQVLELCMDSGIGRIGSVKEGRSYRDPTGLYAVVTCEFALDANFDAVSQLLAALRARHESGLGLRDLKLSLGAQGGACALVASLLTANNPQWKLSPDGTVAPKPESGTAAPATRRSRTGGGRP
jgi:hypothetical protein